MEDIQQLMELFIVIMVLLIGFELWHIFMIITIN